MRESARHGRSGLKTVMAAAVFLLLPLNSTGEQDSTPASDDLDLSGIFTEGYIFQDRNQDDVIDFVEVKILLRQSPIEAEVVAAANIAARLGYETSALNLDLVEHYTGGRVIYESPVIIVGGDFIPPENLHVDWKEVNRELRPGQGSISLIEPGNQFASGGVMVSGSDATGLLEAAEYLSGRFPSVWKMDGTTYEEITGAFTEYLAAKEIGFERLSLQRIVVSSDVEGVAKLVVTINIENEEDFGNLVSNLKDPESDHSDLEFQDLHRIEVAAVGSDRSELIYMHPEKPWRTQPGNSHSPSNFPDFTLSEFYSIEGIYRDTNRDFIPDNTIAYLSVNGTEAPDDLIHLSARIGLESAGIRLPLAIAGGEDDFPDRFGFPIIYGVEHYQASRLIQEGKLYGNIENGGEGYIQFVEKGFNDRNGLVISAPDAEGLTAVTDYVAGRMPYLWEYGKGNFLLEEVETEVRRFFQNKKAAGQVSLALSKIDYWLERIAEKEIETIDVEIAAREKAEGLEAFIVERVEDKFPGASISAATFKTGFGEGRMIFDQNISIPWEVEEFWTVFRTEVLPQITSGSTGSIEVRVSESPAVRAKLKIEIQNELRALGLSENTFSVIVLCAYKQGYSWLYDVILPKVRDRDVGSIEIKYHTLKDSDEIRWQTINADTRWLQELYPVDAVLARELGIPDSAITFFPTQTDHPIYTVKVIDTTGSIILEESFNPRYVVRPFFDLFPEYESVRVTTGWIRADVNGSNIVDRRIRTDPEVFWDYLQNEIYARIIDYVMDLQEGRPSSANAPYFDEFRIELQLSEPDYRLGLDEEVISSMEALHEDIYFETLTLFNLIGGRYSAGSMNFPGRILPHIQPVVDGMPGKARFVFTGRERARPELVLTYTENGEEPVRQRYRLSDLGVDDPVLRGITVRAGEEGLSQLLFEVTAIDSVDRYEEFKERSSEAGIDRSFLPVTLLEDMVENLSQLHSAGLFEDEMNFDRVGEMLFRMTLEDSSGYSRFVSLPRSRHPASTQNPILSDSRFRYRGERMVQWDAPIGLEENSELLARLNTFPGVDVHYMDSSFLGNDVFAIDFLNHLDATHVSQAKLNALKPTLMLVGRTHANEVSSTSHLLRLGELLVTDDTYKEYLKNVNVVIQPIANPDGVSVAYEMQQVNPDFMLHAGYLGALGMNVSSESSSPDPRYPESKVRPRLREMWLPDIFIDNHGYPSHEWVQYFAGYSAWVRNRSGGQRSWWSPRGWFIPGFSWIEDDEYPDIKTAQFAILDSVAVAITSIPEVDAMNRRLYNRYKKYGRQDVESFREYFHNGILVSVSLRGREVSGSGVTNPRITYFSITTEAPDETARGEWLQLLCRAGLAHNTALLRYLNDGVNEIKRETGEFELYVTRTVYREKPVLPKKDEEEEEEPPG